MPRRNWFKLWSDRYLTGTLRNDEVTDLDVISLLNDSDNKMNIQRALIRSVWVDILAMAADGKYGDIGDIKLTDQVGYTDEQIANILNIPLPLWLWAKHVLSENEDPEDNRIAINGSNIIRIINWLKYQSDYQRQKPYRKQKKESSKERKQNLEEEGNIKDSSINNTSTVKDTNNNTTKNREERSENCNLKLLNIVTTGSYKEELQQRYPDLTLTNTFDKEIEKLLLYYSDPASSKIIPNEDQAYIIVLNWLDQARKYRLR